MKTTFILILFVLLFTGSALYFLIQAEGGVKEVPHLLERVGIKLPSPKPALAPQNPDFTSGNSRFSQGTCNTNTDCVQSGCSGEICGNNPNTISSCEFSADFPNVQGYSCGCNAGRCGWTK